MYAVFMIGQQERGMENQVDFPGFGQTELIGNWG